MNELTHALIPMRIARHAAVKLNEAGFDRLATKLLDACAATRERMRDKLSEAICQSITSGCITRHQILHDPLVLQEAMSRLDADRASATNAKRLIVHRLHAMIVNKRITYDKTAGVKVYAMKSEK